MNINLSLADNLDSNLDYLKGEIDKSPETGEFPTITSPSFPVQVDRLKVIVDLSVGAWTQPDKHSNITNWKSMRYLQLKVSSENREVNSSTWIHSATKNELKAFLQKKEEIIPYIEEIFNRSIEHLQIDFNL